MSAIVLEGVEVRTINRKHVRTGSVDHHGASAYGMKSVDLRDTVHVFPLGDGNAHDTPEDFSPFDDPHDEEVVARGAGREVRVLEHLETVGHSGSRRAQHSYEVNEMRVAEENANVVVRLFDLHTTVLEKYHVKPPV